MARAGARLARHRPAARQRARRERRVAREAGHRAVREARAVRRRAEAVRTRDCVEPPLSAGERS